MSRNYGRDMIGGGVCGSPGTNKSTCPLNPKAKKPNPAKHPRATPALARASAPGPVPLPAPVPASAPAPVPVGAPSVQRVASTSSTGIQDQKDQTLDPIFAALIPVRSGDKKAIDAADETLQTLLSSDPTAFRGLFRDPRFSEKDFQVVLRKGQRESDWNIMEALAVPFWLDYLQKRPNARDAEMNVMSYFRNLSLVGALSSLFNVENFWPEDSDPDLEEFVRLYLLAKAREDPSILTKILDPELKTWYGIPFSALASASDWEDQWSLFQYQAQRMIPDFVSAGMVPGQMPSQKAIKTGKTLGDLAKLEGPMIQILLSLPIPELRRMCATDKRVQSFCKKEGTLRDRLDTIQLRDLDKLMKPRSRNVPQYAQVTDFKPAHKIKWEQDLLKYLNSEVIGNTGPAFLDTGIYAFTEDPTNISFVKVPQWLDAERVWDVDLLKITPEKPGTTILAKDIRRAIRNYRPPFDPDVGYVFEGLDTKKKVPEIMWGS